MTWNPNHGDGLCVEFGGLVIWFWSFWIFLAILFDWKKFWILVRVLREFLNMIDFSILFCFIVSRAYNIARAPAG